MAFDPPDPLIHNLIGAYVLESKTIAIESNLLTSNNRKGRTSMKTRGRRINSVVLASALVFLFLAFAAGPATGQEYSKQQQMIDKAKMTFQKFVADPNVGWGPKQAARVKGLLIVPQLLRGAFIFGGAGGSGVFLMRDAKTGKWSDPAFYTMGSASFGLQIGADSSEIVLLVMTTQGAETFLTTSFKLGGDVSVAAGPVGAGVKGQTTFQSADILSYSLAKGVFAGVSLEGAGVAVSQGSNQAYYGEGTRPTDILVTHEAKNPKSADLVAAVAKAMQ
jgi:lipid-binding SYLF domain-containing protein